MSRDKVGTMLEKYLPVVIIAASMYASVEVLGAKMDNLTDVVKANGVEIKQLAQSVGKHDVSIGKLEVKVEELEKRK